MSSSPNSEMFEICPHKMTASLQLLHNLMDFSARLTFWPHKPRTFLAQLCTTWQRSHTKPVVWNPQKGLNCETKICKNCRKCTVTKARIRYKYRRVKVDGTWFHLFIGFINLVPRYLCGIASLYRHCDFILQKLVHYSTEWSHCSQIKL